MSPRWFGHRCQKPYIVTQHLLVSMGVPPPQQHYRLSCVCKWRSHLPPPASQANLNWRYRLSWHWLIIPYFFVYQPCFDDQPPTRAAS